MHVCICLIAVEFQAPGQTRLCLRDETKQSDVTLGLWCMGLMRSASVGGVCVFECEDGLQMVGGWRDLWIYGGSAGPACGTGDRERGRFCNGWWLYEVTTWGVLPVFTDRSLGLIVKDFSGWLIQRSHTLGWGGRICPVCASLFKTFMNSGKRKILMRLSTSRCLHVKKRPNALHCYVLYFVTLIFRQSFQKHTSGGNMCSNLLIVSTSLSRQEQWALTDYWQVPQFVFQMGI